MRRSCSPALRAHLLRPSATVSQRSHYSNRANRAKAPCVPECDEANSPPLQAQSLSRSAFGRAYYPVGNPENGTATEFYSTFDVPGLPATVDNTITDCESRNTTRLSFAPTAHRSHCGNACLVRHILQHFLRRFPGRKNESLVPPPHPPCPFRAF